MLNIFGAIPDWIHERQLRSGFTGDFLVVSVQTYMQDNNHQRDIVNRKIRTSSILFGEGLSLQLFLEFRSLKLNPSNPVTLKDDFDS